MPSAARINLWLLLVVVSWLLAPAVGQATVVRMLTSLGVADIELFDAQAPLTVGNFLNYVNRGDYNNSFIHRSVPHFIVQGGGYAWNSGGTNIFAIPVDAPVVNEFHATRSNLRGTVAMAKIRDNPDSATSQWFINLADNAAVLDSQNGGFTVFGRVMGNGMALFDAMAELNRYSVRNSPFTELPLTNPGGIRPENMVMINSVAVLPTSAAATDSDRLFNYLEAVYPQYLAPASQPSATAYGYYFRYYPGTNAYIATRDGEVCYLGPHSGASILSLGALADWLAVAVSAGY